jgi:hypothetical protein
LPYLSTIFCNLSLSMSRVSALRICNIILIIFIIEFLFLKFNEPKIIDNIANKRTNIFKTISLMSKLDGFTVDYVVTISPVVG